MTIDINKSRINLLGLLFVMFIVAVGVQPAKAGGWDNRESQCVIQYIEDDEWFGEQPSTPVINYKVYNGRVMELLYNMDKIELKRVPNDTTFLEGSRGVGSVNELYQFTKGDLDIFYVEYNTNRGRPASMMVFSDYSHMHKPRNLYQFFDCIHLD